MDADAYSVTS